MFRLTPSLPSTAMFHGRNDLDQRIASGVDLVIDFATLGEYGLASYTASGSCREQTGRRARPTRRPGWEALAAIRRGACGTDASGDAIQWRFPRAPSSRVNFRAALARYAA
jgi:hypothetical protein